MRPWSILRSAAFVVGITQICVTTASAQYYSAQVGDIVDAQGRSVVHHHVACAGCPIVARQRAGTWQYVVPRAPAVDYGQAVPFYQPPLRPLPSHVVPVYPTFPRSGAYPVMGAPVYAPPAADPAVRSRGRVYLAERPYYPSGADPLIITVPPEARARPERRRRE